MLLDLFTDIISQAIQSTTVPLTLTGLFILLLSVVLYAKEVGEAFLAPIVLGMGMGLCLVSFGGIWVLGIGVVVGGLGIFIASLPGNTALDKLNDRLEEAVEEATGEAVDARDKAGEAKTKAEMAQSEAEDARDEAGEALTRAEEAQDDAKKARDDAEKAKEELAKSEAALAGLVSALEANASPQKMLASIIEKTVLADCKIPGYTYVAKSRSLPCDDRALSSPERELLKVGLNMTGLAANTTVDDLLTALK